MREQYMRCGEGFMLCYSVTDRRSFRAAAEYRRLLALARPSERLPLVLVGNKLDLAPRYRQVSTEEGRALATQLGCPFFETSAALRHFVDDTFHALVREIRRLERQRQKCPGLIYQKWVLLQDDNAKSHIVKVTWVVDNGREHVRRRWRGTATLASTAQYFCARIQAPSSKPLGALANSTSVLSAHEKSVNATQYMTER
ncbi:GTP-binding protein Rit2 [Eumeta japonica]|uniref:GTP-binding protein Rit2 n=1 Tax=Eumeta variegata TaxID=151549 RepID=A0A4C1ULE9_EUMVA|nr:GTP-binding protein Rit2 [Eumeta japonica]